MREYTATYVTYKGDKPDSAHEVHFSAKNFREARKFAREYAKGWILRRWKLVKVEGRQA